MCVCVCEGEREKGTESGSIKREREHCVCVDERERGCYVTYHVQFSHLVVARMEHNIPQKD